MGLGPEKKNTAYMIDFGLARKYVFANGEIRPVSSSMPAEIFEMIKFNFLLASRFCRFQRNSAICSHQFS